MSTAKTAGLMIIQPLQYPMDATLKTEHGYNCRYKFAFEWAKCWHYDNRSPPLQRSIELFCMCMQEMCGPQNTYLSVILYHTMYNLLVCNCKMSILRSLQYVEFSLPYTHAQYSNLFPHYSIITCAVGQLSFTVPICDKWYHSKY